MQNVSSIEDAENISFEDALDKAGFGPYSYALTGLAGVVIISFACIFYASVIIVPVSACDLATTGAQQGILAAGPIVGSIFGGVIWGYLADQYGRKNVLMLSLISGATVNALASLSIDWIMLLVLQFLASLLIAGHYSLGMTLLSESVPMEKRNLVVMLVTSLFLLSQAVIAVLAMPIIPLTFSYHLPHLDITWTSWRLLIFIYSLPSIVSAVCLCFMEESPKFLYSRGDANRAMDVLRTIYKFNNKSFRRYPVKTLERRRSYAEILLSGHDLVLSLFRPPLLKYTVIMSLLFMFEQTAAFKVWLPKIAHRFVEILDTGQGNNLTLCDIIGFGLKDDITEGDDDISNPCALNTSALLIVLTVSILTSITNTGMTLVVECTGRRNMAIIVTAIAGTSGMLVNLVPNAIASAVLFVVQLLGLVVLGLYTAMCVALFPTHIRALAVTLTMTGSRIVSFISIQVTNYLFANNCEVAFYGYGAVLALSAVVAALLPSDRVPKPPPHELLHEEETDLYV